jgi:hypothetical protein
MKMNSCSYNYPIFSIISTLEVKHYFGLYVQGRTNKNPLFRLESHDRMCYTLSMKLADVAQSAEHVLGKDEVMGSNPIISSIGSPGRNPGAFLHFWKARIFDKFRNILVLSSGDLSR